MVLGMILMSVVTVALVLVATGTFKRDCGNGWDKAYAKYLKASKK